MELLLFFGDVGFPYLVVWETSEWEEMADDTFEWAGGWE